MTEAENIGPIERENFMFEKKIEIFKQTCYCSCLLRLAARDRVVICL